MNSEKLEVTWIFGTIDLKLDLEACCWNGYGFREVNQARFGAFLLFSLLFFILFLLLDLGPVQMASAWVFTTYHRRWSFPVRRIHRKVTLERYRSVAGFMKPYDGV
jgi:hypothetical protein